MCRKNSLFGLINEKKFSIPNVYLLCTKIRLWVIYLSCVIGEVSSSSRIQNLLKCFGGVGSHQSIWIWIEILIHPIPTFNCWMPKLVADLALNEGWFGFIEVPVTWLSDEILYCGWSSSLWYMIIHSTSIFSFLPLVMKSYYCSARILVLFSFVFFATILTSSLHSNE